MPEYIIHFYLSIEALRSYKKPKVSQSLTGMLRMYYPQRIHHAR